MKLKTFLLSVIYIFILIDFSSAQSSNIKIEPPFWWVGMNNANLQLLVHAENISTYTVNINYKGVEIAKINKTENPNYLFIDLTISPEAKAGKIDIVFNKKKQKKIYYSYELKTRSINSMQREGITNKDIIYLLMPDRFSNGNPSNDNVEGMLEKANRNNPDGRHGGDLQGVSNHLDYFNKLGVTAIWINPVLENNMPNYSYHGYAITNFYKVDARFGSNDDYKNLVEKAQSKNLKIIMDMVFNHCGSNHWWMNDLPSKDWVHQFDKFTRSNYRAEVLMDPNASENDKKLMSDGWFDHSMPDLNQKNPFLANYLIQNSIWWIESVGLDGIRMDTYPYSDQDFMRRWENRIHKEYPNFMILGEAWLQYASQTAWFQNQAYTHNNDDNFSIMITDFPLAYAINSAFNQKDSWTDGMSKLYYTLSKDFLYNEPNDLVIFADNHDIDRFYSTQGLDYAKWKMGMTFLMTTRGIPMLYYGTEYLANGLKHEGDAQLRTDFLGGWENDSINAFTMHGLDSTQIKAFTYLQKLIKLKKENPCLQSGKLIQFIPNDGIYTYFRLGSEHAFMIVLNNTDVQKQITLNPYNEVLKNYNSIRALDKDAFDKIPPQILINAKSAQIFELK